jgi:hypothetical protein
VCRPAKYISPYLPHVVQATVNPDIERKHGTQCSENFVRLPSLALLVHNVALQKYTAPHRELRRGTCTKGRLRNVVERDAEAFRHTLEEGAIAGRALRIQAEVRHRPLFKIMIFTSTPPTSQMQSASGKKCNPESYGRPRSAPAAAREH